MRIHVRNVSKHFGAFSALDRVTLDIASGELIALLGPSGSGKTTLLRIIAGLEWPEEGEVLFDGESALGRNFPSHCCRRPRIVSFGCHCRPPA